MARIKARERSAWQDDPNWKPLAPYEYKHNLTVEPKGVERHRLRMADHNFVRQPSIEKAEQAANSCLLMGLHLPVDPMQLLIRLPRVQLFTYRDAAIYMDMTFSEFEGKYGMKDGFTVRLKDKRGDVYWAVAFRPDVSDYRLRFTLAHELGHIMMDHIGTLHADEIEADFFASCLLAPRVVMEDLRRTTCSPSAAASPSARPSRPAAAGRTPCRRCCNITCAAGTPSSCAGRPTGRRCLSGARKSSSASGGIGSGM